MKLGQESAFLLRAGRESLLYQESRHSGTFSPCYFSGILSQFTATGLPPGLSIGADGLIAGTIASAGNYWVTVDVAAIAYAVARPFGVTVCAD